MIISAAIVTSWKKAFFSAALILPCAAHVCAASQDSPAVARYKEFLSGGGCVQSIRFTQVDGPEQKTFFWGGRCGSNFFLRQVGQTENLSSKVSITNPVTFAFFVGSNQTRDSAC